MKKQADIGQHLQLQRLIQKDKQIIQFLEKEGADISANLACVENRNNIKSDEKYSETLKQHLKDISSSEAEITLEQRELKELQNVEYHTAMELYELKTKHSLLDNNFEQLVRQRKIEENLDSKLQASYKKYNEITQTNRMIREEINHLLHERSTFNTLFQNLKKDIATSKYILQDLLDQSNLAFNKREKFFNAVSALKRQATQQLLQDSLRMRDLRVNYYSGMAIHDLLGIKYQIRIVMSKFRQRFGDTQKQKTRLQELLVEYKSMLDTLRDLFDNADVANLPHIVTQESEEQLSIFNFVNEINKQIQSIKNDEQNTTVVIEGTEEVRRLNELTLSEVISMRETELEKRKKENEEAEVMVRKHKILMNDLQDNILSIFKHLSCDDPKVNSTLGDNSLVNPHNITIFMKAIEHKLMGIVNVVEYLQLTKPPGAPTNHIGHMTMSLMHPKHEEMVMIKQSANYLPQQPCPLCIEEAEKNKVSMESEEVIKKKEISDGMVQSVMMEYEEISHNVSKCRLPESRKIMQKRDR